MTKLVAGQNISITAWEYDRYTIFGTYTVLKDVDLSEFAVKCYREQFDKTEHFDWEQSSFNEKKVKQIKEKVQDNLIYYLKEQGYLKELDVKEVSLNHLYNEIDEAIRKYYEE